VKRAISIVALGIVALSMSTPANAQDEIVCPVFTAATAVTVPGVLEITTDGDVTVLDSTVWDCPPYA
jgi:hypothetical protein